MLRSIAAVLLVLLLGAAAAGAYWQFVMVPAQEQKSAGGPIGGRGGGGPVAVEAQPVRVGSAETTIEAVGTLSADESVVLRPEVTGRIAAINFAEGGRVAKDAVLVELDSTVERAEFAQAEAQLALAQANFERAKELRRSNVGTVRALEEAEANLRIAEAQVELARAKLEKRLLRAPFDAHAGLRNVSIGAFVQAGTEIVNLEKIDVLKVDLRVPEVFLAALDVGQRIALAIDAYPDTTFAGRVTAIDPLVDEAGRAVVLRATIQNEEQAGDRAADAGRLPLRPGLFARARLTLAERENALFVPEQAVQPQGDQHFVFKVADGGEGKKVAQRVPVTLGNRRAGEVEILGGLERGDVIVTAGLLKVRDGAPVQITAPPSGEPAPVSPTPTAQNGGMRRGSAPAAAGAAAG